NGASNDIERATQLAHSMICDWGMSKNLGPINLKKSSSSPFMVGGMGPTVDYSERTAQLIDSEIKELIDTNHAIASKILKDKRDALDRLAEKLIIWETLDLEQVKKIVAGEDIGLPIIEKTSKKKRAADPDEKTEVVQDTATKKPTDPILA
ncbi:MAG: cell division protein FtsH, partial [Bacteriovoracales bacterium]